MKTRQELTDFLRDKNAREVARSTGLSYFNILQIKRGDTEHISAKVTEALSAYAEKGNE